MKALAQHLFWLSQLQGWRRYRRQLGDPRAAQEEVLSAILRSNAGSEWGRAHGFSQIKTPRQFQDQVALGDYSGVEADIGRMRGGEKNVLVSGQASSFEPSGGSSSGPRLIPYTPALRRQFQAGLAPWIFDLYLRYPELRGGSAYWSISPPGSVKKENVGFESDAAYFGGWGERLAGAFMAVPPEFAAIGDIREFRLATLKKLILAKDLRFISVWNPSYLSLLLQELPQVTDKSPAQLWPELRLISCWADAHAASALPPLQAYFPGVEIQPKSLLATEAIVTLPFEGQYPLSVGSHFFEFLDASGRASLAWELELGRVYSVVVSTGGGLYRYRMRDRVEVTGFLKNTPCLRFLGKEDCVSDLRGEKLEEAFVAAALKKLYAHFRLAPAFSIVAPLGAESYALHYEGSAPEGLGPALEAALRANFHYDHCRRLGQLAALQVKEVPSGSGGRYLQARAAQGLALGSLKALALDPRPLALEGLAR